MSVWLTAKECASLPGMPGREHNVRNKLDKCAGGNFEFRRRREGSKAFEYHIDCLPDAARAAVQSRMARQVLADTCSTVPAVVERRGELVVGGEKVQLEIDLYRKCPALLDKRLRELTDNQKATGDARMVIVQEVLRLMDVRDGLNMSRKQAVEFIAAESKAGTLPEHVQRAAGIANAKKGESRSGLSVPTLQRWLSSWMAADTVGERMALLAPGKVSKKEVFEYPWMPDFLRFYRNPNRPSVTMAYEEFAGWWCELNAGNELMLAMLPKVDTVRYALDKLPKAERERGRVTGSEYQSLLPFVRRDWSVLPVNGVWIGDGHGMKLEVINPDTGKPFMPEITLIIDGRTRVVMGWSLSTSESQIAVGDAIRHAVSNYGLPLIYYSDNGGGETNRVFDADITGIFSRLKVTHPTGRPGNPQGRGIIERINREIPMRVAKKFGSYVGKSGDKETQRKYRKQMMSAVNAIEKGKPLNNVQAAVMRKVPSWEQLIAEIEVQIARHNNRPHDSLPKRESGEHWSPLAYRKHVLEQEQTEISYLTSGELHEMFRPEVERTAIRGEVQIFNNRYFSKELVQVEGEKVRVCFDIHDPQTVIIRRMDGSWVCDAVWDGNKVAAFAKSYVEQAKEKSIRRSVKNLETQIQRKQELLRPAIGQPGEIDFSLFAAQQINKEPEKVYLFESELENDLKKAGNHR